MKPLEITVPKGYQAVIDNRVVKIVPTEGAKDITERITSLEDAIEELGEDHIYVIDYRKLVKAGVSEHLVNYQLAVIITRALNGEWEPDWGDSSQYKYQIYFYMGGSSGSGFAYYDYVYWYSDSSCGSRLCFVSGKVAKYVGWKFRDLYSEFFLKQQ